jgi:lipopolysaccharide export LptBFGC system permease protein LptF
MASQEDWDTRKARLESNVLELNDLVNTFVNKTKVTDSLIKEVNNIKENIGEEENRIETADEAAATYDREFLDRKADFPNPFVKNKLYTVQDFTLFFFMVSFIIFSLALSLTLGPSRKVLSGMAILSIVIFGLIMRYA